MDFLTSKTFTNLQTAYNSELNSSTQYQIYGDIARQEGFIEIGNIYDVTARNDREQARIWLRRMREGTLPDTNQTLLNSIETENYKASQMYQEFAQVAQDEGFTDIAALFRGVANIDYNHLTNFEIQHDNLINNRIFCKPNETLWVCMQCGNILSGTCAPEICPICGYPQGYYRELYQNVYI